MIKKIMLIAIGFSLAAACSSQGARAKKDSSMMALVDDVLELMCRGEIEASRLAQALGPIGDRQYDEIEARPFDKAFSNAKIKVADNDQVLSIDLFFADEREFGVAVFENHFGAGERKPTGSIGSEKGFAYPASYKGEGCELGVDIRLTTGSVAGPDNPDPNVFAVRLKRLLDR